MLTKLGELGSVLNKILNFHRTVIAIYDEKNWQLLSDAKTSDTKTSAAKTSRASVSDAKTSGDKISNAKTSGAKTSGAEVSLRQNVSAAKHRR